MVPSFWILQLKYNITEIDFSNFPKPEINKEDFQKSREGINKFQEQMNKQTKKSREIPTGK